MLARELTAVPKPAEEELGFGRWACVPPLGYGPVGLYNQLRLALYLD